MSDGEELAPIDVMDPPIPPNGAAMTVGQFTTPDEVRALQTAIRAHVDVLRSSLQRCAAAGTFTPTTQPSEWDAWQGVKTRAEAYISETPAILATVSQYERGEVLQKELAGWHARAKGFGCDAGPAPTLPDPSTPILSTAGITQTGLLILAILWMLHNEK